MQTIENPSFTGLAIIEIEHFNQAFLLAVTEIELNTPFTKEIRNPQIQEIVILDLGLAVALIIQSFPLTNPRTGGFNPYSTQKEAENLPFPVLFPTIGDCYRETMVGRLR
jgi:hypothetical protein